MLQYLRSTATKPEISQREQLRVGSWVRAERPTEDELSFLFGLGLDADIVNDALDPHEVPRLENEGKWKYLIARLPDTDDDFNDFTTPILFCVSNDYVVTVSRDPLGRMWQPFIDRTAIETAKGNELLIAMIETLVQQYQRRVARINRQMRAATSDVQTLHARDITTLTEYERKLNDYLDAIIPTNTAVERLLNTKSMHFQEDDKDIVEDLSIDLEQVIARCKSLLRTITNTRDSYRAVMDTRLNETIRLLTVMTVALTIPTMAAGIFGMNVSFPFVEHSPLAFWIIVGSSFVIAFIVAYFFLRRRQ